LSNLKEISERKIIFSKKYREFLTMGVW